jgi:hypothetical protein
VSISSLYIAYNGPNPTTAAIPVIATGTAIRTLLQISTPSTRQISVVEWGISFDGSPSAIKAELIQTDVAAGVMPYNNSGAAASLVTLGTGNTGFWVSGMAEGSTTVTRVFDTQILSTNTYVKQWPLGLEPEVAVSKFLRVRVTGAVSVGAICYIVWKE